MTRNSVTLAITMAAMAIGLDGFGKAPAKERVRIEAIVTDRHGQPVEGLRPADFVLRDRGVARPLEAVEFLTSPRFRPSAESPIVTADDERRGASEPGTRVFAFFVDEYHLSPASAARAVEVVDAFIDDKVHPHDLAAVIRPADAIPGLRFTRDRAQLHGVLASVAARRDDSASRRDLVSARLRELAMRFGEMQAHRAILVVISEGFPDGSPDLAHLVRASSLYHFPIYTFNPADEAGEPGVMLHRLAEQTGGLFISVDNAIAGFARIAHDTEAYYSLTYTYPPTTDNTLHAIDVRVTREASIRTRTVYWPDAAGEIRELATRPPATLAVPQRPLHRSPLIDVWVGIRRSADGTGQMTVTWEPRSPLSRSARSVLVTARDANGDPLFERPMATVAVGVGVGEAKDKDVARFAVPPGRVELDLTIRDDADQIVDTDARDVEVPDWRSTTNPGPGPQLLPIEIIRTRTARDAERADAEATPAASRTFMRTNVLVIRTPTFDPSGDAVRVSARVVNLAGRLLSNITPRSDAQFILPLTNLTPGEYQLELIASSAHGKATTRLQFRVVN